ncbi:MAG: tRNA pseudouridine(38-40) synthase TruA [Ignavibacteriota bacterium]
MRLALLIEYDGTDFAGWQVQPGVRTVQSEIETAIAKVLQENLGIIGAGRTDAGVHATGMVAHFDLSDQLTITPEKLCEALNGLTGFDVVIHDIREVVSNFHARYSALSREYQYTISKVKTALKRNYSWHVRQDLNLTSMKSICSEIIGDHDFTSFSKRTDDVEHYRCIVENCEITEISHELVITIRANRFVRGMVRGLAGAMIEVGKGNMSIEHFLKILHTPTQENRAKFLAPAKGLVFIKVLYPNECALWK